MAKTIKVQVTQDDIDHGIADNCHECPVARAANRVAPDGTYASVDGTYLIFQDDVTDSRHIYYRLSQRAERFVHLVDNYMDVKPTGFVFKKMGWR